MADLVVVDEIGYKRRNPWGIFFLSLIPVYWFVWWYKINNELKNHGIKNDPAVATVAVTLGWLIIVPPFVSAYNTAARILRAQKANSASEEIAPVLALILFALTVFWAFPFFIPYYQSQLNKAWDGLVAEGARVIG